MLVVMFLRDQKISIKISNLFKKFIANIKDSGNSIENF